MHPLGLELHIPESTLGAAVGVWFATHLVDDVKYELAVWIGPAHFDATYAVFSDGVGVHSRHGEADFAIRGLEYGSERELELGGFGRFALLGYEGIGSGDIAEVIE